MAVPEQHLSAYSATLDGCPGAWDWTLHLLQESVAWFRADQRLGTISEPRFPRGRPQVVARQLRPWLPESWEQDADVRVAIVTCATKAPKGKAGLRPCVSAT